MKDYKDIPGSPIWEGMKDDSKEYFGKESLLATWASIPWIIDVYVGMDYPVNRREQEMDIWCTEHFGRALTMFNKKGKWGHGHATIHGWTWRGFATEEMMNQFQEQFPNP